MKLLNSAVVILSISLPVLSGCATASFSQNLKLCGKSCESHSMISFHDDEMKCDCVYKGIDKLDKSDK